MKRFLSDTNRLYHSAVDAFLRVDRKAALNLGRAQAAGGEDVAAELLAALRMMKTEALDIASGRVDYERLRHSAAYEQYRTCTARLIRFDPGNLDSRDARLAFWINLYNALVIDAVISFAVRGSVRRDLGFFRRAAYVVGGLRYSADDIEHGVLRGNRRHFHPAVLFPQFSPDDPRLAQAISPVDPRIHCALGCASRSCPSFAAFNAEQVNSQLDASARSFVNSGAVAAGRRSAVVRLSSIFKWYRRDFGGAKGVIEFLLRYLDDGAARDALQAGRRRLRYQRYDWALNAA